MTTQSAHRRLRVALSLLAFAIPCAFAPPAFAQTRLSVPTIPIGVVQTMLPAGMQTIPQTVPANTTIDAVELSGINDDRLSPGLRADLNALKGKIYSADEAAKLADRIQDELPEFVAATRTQSGQQPDHIRLIFVVARISDSDALGDNINARYPVESVSVDGVSREKISDGLWNDMQQMVGQLLNNDEANRIGAALKGELGDRYTVTRRVERGGRRRQLAVIYEVKRIPILDWIGPASTIAAVDNQDFTFFLNVPFTFADELGMKLHVGGGTDGDALTERFKGFRFGIEKMTIGTEHLAFRLNVESYDINWKEETERAALVSPGAFGLYRNRRAIEPAIAYAVVPNFYVTAGFNATSLDMPFPGSHSTSANAVMASAEYRKTFSSSKSNGAAVSKKGRNRSKKSGVQHELEATYSIHAARESMDSDFSYTRHLFTGGYSYTQRNSVVALSVLGGTISGNAPLFERFSLGNSATLRGWDKYEIAPLGGSRMIHGSIEAGLTYVRPFYDVGAIWDAPDSANVRQSIGIAFGTRKAYLAVAGALRHSELDGEVTFRVTW